MRQARPTIDPDALPGPFGLAEDLATLNTPWHAHQRAQLLYATLGALRLRTKGRLWVLPCDRAAWIPSGMPHQVTAERPVQLRTVYFDNLTDGDATTHELSVFEAPPLLRHMAVEACGWGSSPPAGSAAFFEAFRWLVKGWRAKPLPVGLPAASTQRLERALTLLLDRIERPVAAPVALAEAARAAACSARTLQRAAVQELGMGLSTWLQRARMQRALELLATPELAIGEVALRTGYQSPAAFTRAFRQLFGTSPRTYQRPWPADGSGVR